MEEGWMEFSTWAVEPKQKLTHSSLLRTSEDSGWHGNTTTDDGMIPHWSYLDARHQTRPAGAVSQSVHRSDKQNVSDKAYRRRPTYQRGRRESTCCGGYTAVQCTAGGHQSGPDVWHIDTETERYARWQPDHQAGRQAGRPHTHTVRYARHDTARQWSKLSSLSRSLAGWLARRPSHPPTHLLARTDRPTDQRTGLG